MRSIMKTTILKYKIIVSLLLISIFFMSSCGIIPGTTSSDDDNFFLLLLGLGGGGSETASAPEFRVNGFLRDKNNQALRRHGLEKDGIIHLTNSSGFFSLYLNAGRHTVQVTNVDRENLGSFSFEIVDVNTTPTVEYSGEVDFIIVWEDVIQLPLNTIDLSLGQAEVVINEVAPRATSGPKVELFVVSGGNLRSAQICARNSCSELPEVRVRSGEYILLHEGDGINDSIISDGDISNAWEFYGLPGLVSTDSIVYVRSAGNPYESVVIYADNGGTWNGCNGSSGVASCIPPILSAGQWTQEGETWEESDAIIRTAPTGTFFNNSDTIKRCPNGSRSTGKSAFVYSYDVADRNLGGLNVTCPGFNLIAASATSSTSLTATFSVNPTSGGNTLSNYKIFEGSSCSGTELDITNVSLSGATATLTTSTQNQGGNYILCVENMIGTGDLPLGGSSVVFSGFAPTALLAINELAPGLPAATDFVEFFVITGGSIGNLDYCYRAFSGTGCRKFPDRIVEAGDYIVWYSNTDDSNNQNKSEGNPNYWEFYGIDNPAGTDGVMIVKNGPNIQSAIAYANGDGSWTGCAGTSGNTNCIDPVVTANAWPQAGGSWAESDAVRKNPPSGFGSSDTIAKIPNGTGSDSLSTWRVYTNTALRTIGSANIEPVSVGRGQIVINEVRRESSNHWVEFYNRTSQSINLAEAGLRFRRVGTCDAGWANNSTNTVALTGTIPANGYYVLAVNAGFPGNEDQVGNFSAFTDNNCIFLVKGTNPTTISDDTIIDFVGWGSASAFQGSATTNLANNGILQRVPNGNYSAGESHADAFGFVASCPGTPKAANPGTNICFDGTPPTVASTTPANSATGVALTSTIAITFSKAMNTSTITTHNSTTCSGTLQVSTDSGFSSCIAMTNATPSVGGNTYTVTPSSDLPASTTIYVRITTGVQDSFGINLESAFNSSFGTGDGSEPALLGLINPSFEDDTNNCPQSANGVGCPNGWTMAGSTAGAELQAILASSIGITAQNGNNISRFSNLTTNIAAREFLSNCFALDGSQSLTVNGYFYTPDPVVDSEVRLGSRYYTDSDCSNQITFSGSTISNIASQSTWDLKSNTRGANATATHARISVSSRRIPASASVFFDNFSVSQP
ncbi:MAG: Ig-like domain-containing protein [Leptospira sp.]|nr:Ig-like domain-containing protein [Leptospira sp.]